MSYRDQLQDTDYYDDWGNDGDGDPRDYSRQGERAFVTTRRYPQGQLATIEYQVPGTTCYCLAVPGIAWEWKARTYALAAEMTA